LAGLKKMYEGNDVAAKIKEVNDHLLENMLEDTLLLEYASQRFDVSKIVDYQMESMRKERHLEDDALFKSFLAKEGISEETLRKKIEGFFVPEFVRSREIRSQIKISTVEIQNYFDEHKEEFKKNTTLSPQ